MSCISWYKFNPKRQGLSLNYDLVKALGGELKVETKVGVETDFLLTHLSKN